MELIPKSDNNNKFSNSIKIRLSNLFSEKIFFIPHVKKSFAVCKEFLKKEKN
ncbi:hypothetical protein [Buchnera aphidicola]|uniref:hypothetical protein n=1 Tax=Buchnera aphidicola TaxID=9 RepID=UPI001E347487|nr:hypothetical protein [Buchnera aphidicola]